MNGTAPLIRYSNGGVLQLRILPLATKMKFLQLPLKGKKFTNKFFVHSRD